jgi:SAM-dependent methyltransferase
MTPPQLNLKNALDQILEPSGKTVIDIGCGDGAIVRHLARRGAKAIGIEVSGGQLQRALRKAGPSEHYGIASAERLPFPDASAGAILFMNSLHHVAMPLIATALREAARVLEPGGQLIAVEPLAEGTYFETMRPLEDETEVRAAAYAALCRPPAALVAEDELIFDSIVHFKSAGQFLEAVAAPNPERRRRLPEVGDELRRRYERNAQHDGDGTFFIAPMRRNHFRKTG